MKIIGANLVRGIPKIEYFNDHLCDACMHMKQTKFVFHCTSKHSTSHNVEILHMDLFELVSTTSMTKSMG